MNFFSLVTLICFEFESFKFQWKNVQAYTFALRCVTKNSMLRASPLVLDQRVGGTPLRWVNDIRYDTNLVEPCKDDDAKLPQANAAIVRQINLFKSL